MANLQTLLPFSSERRAFRAFGHAIAAEPGLVAMAPLYALEGSLLGLVDGCPVPWEEACMVMDTQADSPIELDSICFTDVVARLANIATEGWCMGVLAELKAVVFAHQNGLKVAIAADLAFKR